MSLCHEKEIYYPKNDASTCWWLSMNLCLFHTKRKELEDFFFSTENIYKEYYSSIDQSITKNSNSIISQEIKQIYKILYLFYTNQKDNLNTILKEGGFEVDINNEIELARFVKDLRLKPELKIFETDDFKISSSLFQDADEYFVKLTDMIPNFKNILFESKLHKKDEANINLSENKNYEITNTYMINTLYNLYDIQIWRKLEDGENNNVEFKGEEVIQKIKTSITDYTNTLLLKFNPYKYTDGEPVKDSTIDFIPQKTIQIPLVNINDNMSIKDEIFYLDAILCYRLNTHYWAYVKCSETDEWIKYNAMSEGKIEKSLSYEELLNEEDVKKNTIMLFYTR